jgi:hypothetical protein
MPVVVVKPEFKQPSPQTVFFAKLDEESPLLNQNVQYICISHVYLGGGRDYDPAYQVWCFLPCCGSFVSPTHIVRIGGYEAERFRSNPAADLAGKESLHCKRGRESAFLQRCNIYRRPTAAYDEFYAGMKSSGRYELAGAPADADLSFEIEMAVNRAGARISQEPNLLGDVPYDPYFRLVIRDPKSNAILWVTIEHVQWAILQGNRDKNFDQALARLVSDVESLAVRSAAAASGEKQ